METQALYEKWEKLIDPKASDGAQRVRALSKPAIMAQLLENQEDWNNKHKAQLRMDETADSGNTMGSGAIATWSPVLMSLVRRTAPNLLSMDFFGTQPTATPTALIFAMRVRANNQTGAELFHRNKPDGTLSGGTDGKPMSTSDSEKLGGSKAWGKIGISIESSSLQVGTRGLYTDYSHEVRQDMMAVHGQDVDQILSDALVIEVQAEQNREFIETMNLAAKAGGVFGGFESDGTTPLAANVGSGTFDVAADGDGRWMLERAKTMLWQLEQNANAIMLDTRAGKANKVLASPNVASFLAIAGLLDWNIAVTVKQKDLNIDINESYAGKLANGMDLFIDQYAIEDYITLAYKGSEMSAGIYYSPYTPLEMYRGQGEDNMQPRIAFKTRYALIANPFYTNTEDGTAVAGKGLGEGENGYFRHFKVTNIG